jgi:hypothetical protein
LDILSIEERALLNEYCDLHAVGSSKINDLRFRDILRKRHLIPELHHMNSGNIIAGTHQNPNEATEAVNAHLNMTAGDRGKARVYSSIANRDRGGLSAPYMERE